ncbi:MAG: nuclease-related domain-containing protein [Candidatus Brocadiia bacterium]
MTSRETKSPIRVKPLRQAGQSLSERLEDLIYERALPAYLVAAMLVLLAVLEWIRYALKAPPALGFAVFLTFVAVVAVVWTVWRFARLFSEARQIRLGLEGEKAIGECLERLRADGYQVFHDIPGDGFNVDHVIVGPGGVFTIETKTIRKPARGESKVEFDGEKITVGGFTPDRDPVAQVQAAARHVKFIIKQTSGRDVFVRPVLLYPGWYTTQPDKTDIWVLNENAFPKFIQKESQQVDAGSVHLIAAGIAMHVRNVMDRKT